MPDLEHDSALRLPLVTVLKASAGSGKTFRLTQRFVQFLLSEKIPHNELRGLVALTFSHNAARQMRDQVLEWLKRLALKDPERLREMAEVTSGGAERLSRRASAEIELVLSRLSELQVMTLDSFTASIFRASAIDFGFGPDFEVVLDPGPLVDYAWNLFLREARAGSAEARLLDRTVASVLDFSSSSGAFPWNPSADLLEELRRLESRLSLHPDALRPAETAETALRSCEERVVREWETLADLVQRSGLEPRRNSRFAGLLDSVRARRFSDLVSGALKNGPLKKPARGDRAGRDAWERVEEGWRRAAEAVDAYASAWARSYYQPFLRLQAQLSSSLEAAKRGQARIFLGDISRKLAAMLEADVVPDVYFRLGERIWHYLVDEFQDTSPLQWKTLFPLVENSLAMNGSLFLVGDTKQAIYGFRQADYTIMKGLEAGSPFPSAPVDVRELATNWRSRPQLVEFVRQVFLTAAAGSEAHREAARRSGLDEWVQNARPGGSRGYVEVDVLPRDEEDPSERVKLQQLVKELRSRGYGWEDIALLAPRNADVVRATSWLNDIGVPFLSFSSLDVRTRTVAAEIFALLAFLDSPPDDLSFATFVLGTIFGRALRERAPSSAETPTTEDVRALLVAHRTERPLYKAFQRAFPGLWKEKFADLFRSAGYLPLYDLVSEAFTRFAVFERAGEEEATLVKVLEVVRDFEAAGAGSLREFLGTAARGPTAEEAAAWAIDVPREAPSVRAMTIHKAKGLGFPVVIVLLYGESRRGVSQGTLVDDDGTVRLVKLNRDLARRDEALQRLYDEETMKAHVDALNRLYVALTRAERELYVIGVRSDKDSFPFDLLPAESFPPRADKGAVEAPSAAHGPQVASSHDSRPMRLAPSPGPLGREERRRGELAHRVLELIEETGGPLHARLAAAAERAAREARGDPEAARALLPKLGLLLSQPDLQECFQPRAGRLMRAEQELCDSRGRLLRLDRLVVDPDRLVVVEYKTGEEQPAEHEAQVRDYMAVLRGAYPGRLVSALVAYVDLGTLRRFT